MRYNPPPNWPTPPVGWEPEPDWRPDPTWPAPPAGWPLWIPNNSAAPETGQPTKPRAQKRRWVLVAGTALAALVLTTGTWKVLSSAGTEDVAQCLLPFDGLDKRPFAIDVDATGTVYAVSADEHTNDVVLALTAGPEFQQTEITMPSHDLSGSASGLALDPDQNMYFSSRNGDGKGSEYPQVFIVPARSTNPTLLPHQFPGVNDVAVDRLGNLYAVGGRDVRVFEPESSTGTTIWTTDGSILTNVALDRVGNVYVLQTTNNGSPSRVIKLSADSYTPTQLPFDDLVNPIAISVTANGDVYLADSGTFARTNGDGRILKLPSEAATPTTLVNDLTVTTAMAVDSGGQLYIAESKGVRKLSPSGECMGY